MCYKFVHTDSNGKSREVTEREFEEFKEKYPAMAKFLENPDTYVTEEIIMRSRDKDRWEKLAKKLMQQIAKVKGAFLFSVPVDVKKYSGIDDYYDVIKKPMDFQTIKNKLTNNVYANVLEFNDDMEQVFKNCILYNKEHTDVGKAGIEVWDEYKILCSTIGLSPYI